MSEARKVAHGAGWAVHRLGHSFCVSIDRTDSDKPAEVWLNRPPTDMARGALLGALVAGTYGKVDRATALEAMGADW